MKRLHLTIQALTLVVLLAANTFAGNIGGMRTESASSSVKSTGNIGGLLFDELYTGIVIAIAGNIGGL